MLLLKLPLRPTTLGRLSRASILTILPVEHPSRPSKQTINDDPLLNVTTVDNGQIDTAEFDWNSSAKKY